MNRLVSPRGAASCRVARRRRARSGRPALTPDTSPATSASPRPWSIAALWLPALPRTGTIGAGADNETRQRYDLGHEHCTYTFSILSASDRVRAATGNAESPCPGGGEGKGLVRAMSGYAPGPLYRNNIANLRTAGAGIGVCGPLRRCGRSSWMRASILLPGQMARAGVRSRPARPRRSPQPACSTPVPCSCAACMYTCRGYCTSQSCRPGSPGSHARSSRRARRAVPEARYRPGPVLAFGCPGGTVRTVARPRSAR
jgi:hypothetical protein